MSIFTHIVITLLIIITIGIIIGIIIIINKNKESESYKHIRNIYNHKLSKKFDKQNLINPHTDTYNKILEWFEKFAVNHNINYSIAYGTLLGQLRDKNYIPYDEDTDIFISKSDVYRLFELYKLKEKLNIQDIYINSELKENNEKILPTKVSLLLTSEHENKVNDKDRKRWDCNGNGDSEPNYIRDICAFNGPVARIIFNHKQCDIFVWSDKKPSDMEYAENCKNDPNKLNNYCEFIATQYGSELPKTKPCKLNKIWVRKFADKQLIKDNMIRWYGINYMKPNQLYLDNKLVNITEPNDLINESFKGGFDYVWNDKKIYQMSNKLLKTIIKVYNKYDIPVVAYGGTLLGIIRHNGKFIPWDDDIDITVSEKLFIKNFENIKKDLSKKGISTYTEEGRQGKHYYENNKKIKPYDWSYPYIDLFLQSDNGNIIGEPQYDGKFPLFTKNNTKYSKLNGFDILIPNDSNDILNKLYGDDWTIMCHGLDYNHEEEKHVDETKRNLKKKCKDVSTFELFKKYV